MQITVIKFKYKFTIDNNKYVIVTIYFVTFVWVVVPLIYIYAIQGIPWRRVRDPLL